MHESYLSTLRLLLRILPTVFEGGRLALKGGTAINLFVNDFPRVSVDIDCTFVDASLKRAKALLEIQGEIERMAGAYESAEFKVKRVGAGDKLTVSDGKTVVKIEINTVMRGILLSAIQMPVCKALQTLIPSASYSIPVLHPDELYAGKIVAALDRQHPRDLFDILLLLQNQGVTDQMLDCFAIYLAGHNRPMHEVLAGNDQPLEDVYHTSFVGMTKEAVKLEQLENTRRQLRTMLLERLGERRKRFLHTFAAAQPDWTLSVFASARNFPAIKWKLQNLNKLRRSNPNKWMDQLNLLDRTLGL